MNAVKLSGAGLVGLLALALSGGAAAEPPSLVEPGAGLPRAAARYGSLNRAHASGQDARTAYLRSAARRLCLHNGIEPLRLAICFSSAIEDAHARMTKAVADYGATRSAQRKSIDATRREQRLVRCKFPLR